MPEELLIKCSRGIEKADLVLKGGNIINVFSNEIIVGDIAIKDGIIVGVGTYSGIKEIDVTGKYISPGFIDSHLHLESTMVMPNQLIYHASKYGTTTFIIDPHEAANVCGTEGIDFILEFTRDSMANVYVMVPSCVPATDFEDNGFLLNADNMTKYIDNQRILGLGEVMNVDSVLACNLEMMNKLNLFSQKIIDGHAPNLSDYDLSAYILSGISTNHEYYDYENAIKGLRNGMKILIREGSAAKNLELIVNGIISNNTPIENFAFCTDDKHIEEILREGHISSNIKKAISLGLSPISAYKIATINAANIYGLKHLGAIAPGYQADLVILNDLEKVEVHTVLFKGEIIGEIKPIANKTKISTSLLNTINIKNISKLDFKVNITKSDNLVHAIELVDGQILTNHITVDISKLDNTFQKISVIERHNSTGLIGVGYVKNFGNLNGSIASSVSHDSHNIVVVGSNDADMLLAVETLKSLNGGFVIVQNGVVMDSLPLEIMGLISNKEYKYVNMKLKNMLDIAYNQLGVNKLIDPFITLSFLALPVIPEIRITARGIYDVTNKHFIDSVTTTCSSGN